MMHQEKILILAKTYPVPSAKYDETTCVAGINENGHMRRLFPIQFRFIDGERQFKKWQWITVSIKKAPKDHRLESHIINSETIDCGEVLSTGRYWEARRNWLEKIPTFTHLDSLEEARQRRGVTLAVLRPAKMLELEITPEAEPSWTPEEINKLLKHERQTDLFRSQESTRVLLQKIPFSFHYRYLAKTPEGVEIEQKHKIIDWEVCELYRRCQREYGANWEERFRAKLEGELFQKDLMLMMGTMHRIPDQWLVISLIYPPPKPDGFHEQRSLFP